MAFLNTLPTEKRTNVIERCQNALPNEHLDHQLYGNSVLQLDPGKVVKYGLGVSRAEAENQASISLIVDQEIVRVPKVYDWFEDAQGRGYLVMEFMEGERAKSLTGVRYLAQLQRILEHLHSLKADKIGPLHNNVHQTILFGEDSSPELASVQDVEAWFTRRLCDDSIRIDISDFDLVLCHLDFTCRNILWKEGRPPCLLDWKWAGFYPRFFERCSHDIVGREVDGNVVADMHLSHAEQVQHELIMRAFANDMRFCL